MEDPTHTIQTHFVQPALPLISVLEQLHIRYYVGGSVASILWGFYRRAADLDLILDLIPTQIPALVEQLTPTHYIVAARLYEAIYQAGVCNVFPFADPLKIDLHVPRRAPFGDAAFVRALRVRGRIHRFGYPSPRRKT